MSACVTVLALLRYDYNTVRDGSSIRDNRHNYRADAAAKGRYSVKSARGVFARRVFARIRAREHPVWRIVEKRNSARGYLIRHFFFFASARISIKREGKKRTVEGSEGETAVPDDGGIRRRP